MIQLAAPAAAIAAVGATAHALLRAGWKNARARRASGERARPTAEQLERWVREHGGSGNSFMTLYPGFDWFSHPDASVEGAIAFVETTDAWVGGAEPFCRPEDRERLLGAFADAAAALGRAALMLPVDAETVLVARRAGYRSVMIGTEPTWRLDRFPRTGRTWTDVVPTAKALAGRGAQVTEFAPAKLSAEDRAGLEKMTEDWLGTRKMDALAFLNQVDPWYRAEDKKFFRIDHQGRTLAFLAAVPIWARKGWYLIDLIRRPDSPAGATELLLLLAMRGLREQGAELCTMGVAPYSGIERAAQFEASDYAANRLTYKILYAIYDKGNALYNFKPLHQYKLKFDPTEQPPMFLLYRPKFGLRALVGLLRAFQPEGLARATWSGALRTAARFSLSEWIQAQLTTRAVVRSVPPSWGRLLGRCKFTVAMLAANCVAFVLTTGASGRLPQDTEAAWGFSWQSFASSPWHALALSPLLHWSIPHLCFNILGMALFTGGLEYLAGSGLTAACYLIPMLVANPATAGLLALLKPWVAAINLSEIDVGASLGIFGTAGALSRFLRWGPWLSGGLALGAAASAWAMHGFMPLNHVVALGLGWLVSYILLRG